jgi:hypothetical protein
MCLAATAACAMALTIGAGAARADLPALVVEETTGDFVYGFDPGVNTVSSGRTFGTVTGHLGSMASAASTPGGSVFAFAPDPSTVASADLLYSAEIDGPADMTIPVVLSYRLFVKNLASGSIHNGSAQASIAGPGATTGFDDQLYTANYSSDIYESCYTGCVAPGRATAEVTTNTAFKIGVIVDVRGAEAYADPMLSIDPTWAKMNPTVAKQLSLSFSDGITNALGNFTLGVPEPASWALMIVGFGLAGAGLRRRRLVAA